MEINQLKPSEQKELTKEQKQALTIFQYKEESIVVKPDIPQQLLTTLKQHFQQYKEREYFLNSPGEENGHFIGYLLNQKGIDGFSKYLEATSKEQLQQLLLGQFYQKHERTFNFVVQVSQFSKLQRLYLGYYDFSNMEFLSFIQCPSLAEIKIYNYNGQSLKPFKKVNFPQLHILQIFLKDEQNMSLNIQIDNIFSRTQFANGLHYFGLDCEFWNASFTDVHMNAIDDLIKTKSSYKSDQSMIAIQQINYDYQTKRYLKRFPNVEFKI